MLKLCYHCYFTIFSIKKNVNTQIQDYIMKHLNFYSIIVEEVVGKINGKNQEEEDHPILLVSRIILMKKVVVDHLLTLLNFAMKTMIFHQHLNRVLCLLISLVIWLHLNPRMFQTLPGMKTVEKIQNVH